MYGYFLRLNRFDDLPMPIGFGPQEIQTCRMAAYVPVQLLTGFGLLPALLLDTYGVNYS